MYLLYEMRNEQRIQSQQLEAHVRNKLNNTMTACDGINEWRTVIIVARNPRAQNGK